MQWYENSKGFLDADFTEVWLHFAYLWDNKKVRFAKMDSLKTAISRAELRQQDRPEIAFLRNECIIELAHVCYELQQLQGDKPFFLSQADAGKVICKDQKTGRLALMFLQNKGIIELVSKGHTGKSSEYRYTAMPPENRALSIKEQIKQIKSEDT